MSFYASESFIAGVLLVCLWSILCRLAMLPPAKRTLLPAVQLFALGLGLFGGLMLPGTGGRAALAVGVAAFLAAGAHRWRFGAPGSLAGQPSPARTSDAA